MVVRRSWAVIHMLHSSITVCFFPWRSCRFSASVSSIAIRTSGRSQRIQQLLRGNSSPFEHYHEPLVCVRTQETTKFSTITLKCFQGLSWWRVPSASIILSESLWLDFCSHMMFGLNASAHVIKVWKHTDFEFVGEEAESDVWQVYYIWYKCRNGFQKLWD